MAVPAREDQHLDLGSGVGHSGEREKRATHGTDLAPVLH